MPKRKADAAGDKESSKVTKQESTRRSERLSRISAAPKPEVKPKKTEKAVVKKSVEEKPAVTAKKATAKGKKDAAVAHNGQDKSEETEEAESATEEKA
ncbi:hypothetical protein NHX12_026862 [Muraenolepis orangiensis]|uniref:High mobility group nucleosome-binding domain-containing protein 3 n=1 Tax=Muraenolepis orangiensis TaxID=630683 RepID=A0A9Q0INQ1_9TELE|nr:hypothetical protein NHX12_026862 [Muraenolepis orangiensis]